jgi:hypothetical protein
VLTITWHKALLAMLACLCAAAVSPYLSDIHDLDGRQLSCFDMPSLWGEEEERYGSGDIRLWQDIKVASSRADHLIVSIAATC